MAEEDLKSLPELELTQNVYSYPIPEGTKVDHLTYENKAHQGPFKGAVDIAVDNETTVLAPLAGKVLKVVDGSDQYGKTREFAKLANYIDIEHANGEISQLVHLAKGSAIVAVGDEVIQGQEIARTGLSGWMSRPHLHWMVFKRLPDKPEFQGLKIQLVRPLEDLVIEDTE